MKPEIIQALTVESNPPTAKLFYGADARETLRQLPAESVHMACTSPPYWGLRDYGLEPTVWGGNADCTHEWGRKIPPNSRHLYSQENSGKESVVAGAGGYPQSQGSYCMKCGAWKGCLGLEPDPRAYVTHLVEVLMEVWRVLRPDGTLWLNLGDTYANDLKWGGSTGGKHAKGLLGDTTIGRTKRHSGLKPKDLVGIPWRVALALQDAGWYLRSDIIWAKPNPMPESVQDRPTKSHEYVFLLAKQEHYFYDQFAVRENASTNSHGGGNPVTDKKLNVTWPGGQSGLMVGVPAGGEGKNRRTIWTIGSDPYPGAHFATWPPKLAELMVKAGSSEKGCCSICGAPFHPPLDWEPTCSCPNPKKQRAVVLDPFSGSATTGMVALQLGRDYIGIDANAEYLALARARILGMAAPEAKTEDDQGSVLDLL